MAEVEKWAVPAGKVRMTIKDRVIFFVFGAGLVALGVSMFMHPDFVMEGSAESARARTRLILWILEMVWSRPVGVILFLLGLLMFVGMCQKFKDAPKMSVSVVKPPEQGGPSA